MQKAIIKRSLGHLVLSLSSALLLSAPAIAADNNNIYNNNNSTPFVAKNALADGQKLSIEQASSPSFSSAELEQMLAPIALYPDALLTHILIASTYPIEVVDAERWLSKNPQLTTKTNTQAIAEAAEEKDWDASVKALLPFPTILKELSEDLHWMRDLGDAFLQDETQVLASVQVLREKADQAGNLNNMSNVNVIRETRTIIIEPRQTDVIYVPYYDSRVVYGNWRWAHHPPIYWHQPRHFASHHGPYYWHNPVHLSVGLFFGAVQWNNRHVVVHHHKSRYYKRHSNRKASTSYQAQRWQHNPRHRKGVAYRTTQIQKKYRSHAQSAQQHKVIRSKQKHFITNKHVTKNTSQQHQSLNHKLKVNRAQKIDKHQLRRTRLTKTEPYKQDKWQKNKVKSHVYKGNKATEQSTRSHAKRHENKHISTKSYTKPVNNVRHTVSKAQRQKIEKREHKRSNTRVEQHRKHNTMRAQQSKVRQQN